jgi:polyisoprenoid-binding protein YceI
MGTASPALVHYAVDAKASRFTVQVFATGLLSAMGHNPIIGIRKFTGDVDFSPESMTASEFRLTIQANSLSVLDDISDKDRREIERMMNEQVLETTRYPAIVYEAPELNITKLGDALYSAEMDGSLRFHGVTRVQPLTARIAVFGEMLRASGGFTLKQSDYQIKPISVAGGALKLKDELKFVFEMVIRKQE